MSSFPGTTQQKLQLSSNDIRQCLRIAFGGTLCFVVCKLMGWNYGTFFAVNPMLLLGLVPVLATASTSRRRRSAIMSLPSARSGP